MIGTSLNPPTLEQIPGGVCSLLIFQLAGQAFALSIDHVSQIIPMLKLTPLPQSSERIAGVFNLHGKIVPVISFRRLLGLPDREAELYTPILLTRLGDQQVGWIVDEVMDVISLPALSIRPPGEILPEGLPYAQVMSGLIYQQERPVILLDSGCIQRSAQFRAISQLLVEQKLPLAPQVVHGNDAADGMKPDELRGRARIEQIWAQRAAQMAKVEDQDEEPGEHLSAVLLCLGRELLGLDVQYVLDIRPRGTITRVPRVPAWVEGVTHLRGHILPVIHLRKYFDLPVETGEGGREEGGLLVYVRATLEETARSTRTVSGQKLSHGPTEVIFLVSDVLSMETLTIRQKREDSSLIHPLGAEYIRATAERQGRAPTSGRWAAQRYLAILDAPALLSDPRMCINQEVV